MAEPREYSEQTVQEALAIYRDEGPAVAAKRLGIPRQP
jgi:hypothetical protein